MSYIYTYGSGTENDPYQVWTAADLDGVRDHLSSYFIQMDDIDLGAWGNWTPIGGYFTQTGVEFQGQYNGNDFIIDNLIIIDATAEEIGLFGCTEHATIQNAHLRNVDIDANFQVGALIGFSISTNIEGCSSTGSVKCNGRWSGGIVGDFRLSHIKNSWSSCNVVGLQEVGGLIGVSPSGHSVDTCYATGIVEGTKYVGGLIGWIGYFQHITNSYATGDVSGEDYVGGLIGYCNLYEPYHDDPAISHCYAIGDVTGGDEYVGGLIGEVETYLLGSPYTKISESYALGNIYSSVDYPFGYGGFIGVVTGVPYINNCYCRGSISLSASTPYRVGGFVGYVNNVGVYHCYAAGGFVIASAGWDTGGFCGDGDNALFVNSYYDTETSGQSDTGKGEPRTTAQMTYPYSEPENVYIDWAFYGEDDNPIWRHDKEGLRYDVTQIIREPLFIIDTCLVHGPDHSFVEYRLLAHLLHQKTYWDGATLMFAGHDLTAHIKEYSGITYLPVRYIAGDLLNLGVWWNEADWQVHISGNVVGPINDGYPHFIQGLILKYRYLRALPGGTFSYF